MKQRKALTTILTLAFLTLLSPRAGSDPVFRTLYVFTGGTTGSQPDSGVVMDKFGNLYGTTLSGGMSEACAPLSQMGCGVVFQLVPIKHEGDSLTSMETDSAKTPVAWQENVIYTFHGKDGAVPGAPPVIDKHGDLFGTTEVGGPVDCRAGLGCGVAFQLSRQGNDKWTEQVIAQFGNGNGVIPMAPLTFDHEGNLYGTTSGYFTFLDTGTVFKLSPEHHGGWTTTVLYHFNAFDGLTPMSGVIFDPEGNLYGTTIYGGQIEEGNVYRLSPNADGTWTETVLHTFTDSFFGGPDEGSNPQGGLVRDSNGNLFGTTYYGGPGGAGSVYELKPNSDGSWTLRTIAGVTNPVASLVMDKAGALYGMTPEGAFTLDCGDVFKLTPEGDDNWSEDIIYRFDGTYGCASHGPLFMDSMGHLYGTTRGDGVTTFGSVFEITP